MIEHSIGLSCTGLDTLQLEYKEKHGVVPTTLIIGPTLAMTAYECLREEIFRHLIVVVAPGFPEDGWILCGSKEILLSEVS